MDRFHLIDDAAVILRSKGVYRQAKVYHRAEGLYAAWGAGFVRLYKGGGTGIPTVNWDDMDIMGHASPAMAFDVHGKLSLPSSAIKQIANAGK